MYEDCTRTGCAGGGGNFFFLLGIPWIIGFPILLFIGFWISNYLLEAIGIKLLAKILLLPLTLGTSYLLIKGWIELGLFVFSL